MGLQTGKTYETGIPKKALISNQRFGEVDTIRAYYTAGYGTPATGFLNHTEIYVFSGKPLRLEHDVLVATPNPLVGLGYLVHESLPYESGIVSEEFDDFKLRTCSQIKSMAILLKLGMIKEGSVITINGQIPNWDKWDELKEVQKMLG